MALFRQQCNITKKLIGGNVNPCLYIKKIEKDIEYIPFYVDNNLMVGDLEAIFKAITALKENALVLKIEERLHNYLTCNVRYSGDKKRAWLGQSHLIESFEKKFSMIQSRRYKVTKHKVH